MPVIVRGIFSTGAALACAIPPKRNAPANNAKRTPDVRGRRVFLLSFLREAKVIVWVVVAVWVLGAAVMSLCVSANQEKSLLGFIFLFVNDCMNLKYVFTVITFLCIEDRTHPFVSDFKY